MLQEFWRLVRQQHWVITRAQLLELGFSRKAIEHRIRAGRLRRVYPGVYAVGHRELSDRGRWMAAVLACGPEAALSHESAGELWKLCPDRGRLKVSVPIDVVRQPRGLTVHRRATLTKSAVTKRWNIPVTTPAYTLVDLASRLSRNSLETAINQADNQDLIDPDALRVELDRHRGQPGVATLRHLLDRHTLVLTDTELERLFVPIAASAGLPRPETQAWLSGFRVDFFWPELGLVVETDSLRYHRTPVQQTTDRLRDQAHARAGLTPLRFTHAQVKYDPDDVRDTLIAVVRRIRK